MAHFFGGASALGGAGAAGASGFAGALGFAGCSGAFFSSGFILLPLSGFVSEGLGKQGAHL